MSTCCLLLTLAACGDDGASPAGASSSADASTEPQDAGADRPDRQLGSLFRDAGRAGGPGASDAGDSGSGLEASVTPALDAAVLETLPAPQLRSPADGATDAEIQGELCWDEIEGSAGRDIRYHVVIDDMPLSTGVLDTEGFAGPCTGPLDFNFEQTYRWYVVAFDADQPSAESMPSATWSFTTLADEEMRVVFEDGFEQDAGWTVSGDATHGHWTLGQPTRTTYRESGASGQVVSQPGSCDSGGRCFFTADNPTGDPQDQDVAGGSTTLLSPSFDLSGFSAASISLARFFYKSEAEQTGSSLRVELVVPDPDGDRVFVLEQLELNGSMNAWTPVTYWTCGLPHADGTRLRITATDEGRGVVEAAIDSVVVTGYRDSDPCSPGPGALCDPQSASPCGDTGLLCCAQGVFQSGVYRCEEAVAGLDWDAPPASIDDPNNGALGCDAPDLLIREDMLDLEIDQLYIEPGSCAIAEGCVGGSGFRRVLRFATATPNIGSKDLRLGVPSNHPERFTYSACHDHYHFDGYAEYTLFDATGAPLATRTKQAFCLLDWESWAWPRLSYSDAVYSCYNQGISRGFQDVYDKDLDCQWIDITDLPAGDYMFRVDINPVPDGASVPILVERDYDNNSVTVPVSIP